MQQPLSISHLSPSMILSRYIPDVSVALLSMAFFSPCEVLLKLKYDNFLAVTKEGSERDLLSEHQGCSVHPEGKELNVVARAKPTPLATCQRLVCTTLCFYLNALLKTNQLCSLPVSHPLHPSFLRDKRGKYLLFPSHRLLSPRD